MIYCKIKNNSDNKVIFNASLEALGRFWAEEWSIYFNKLIWLVTVWKIYYRCAWIQAENQLWSYYSNQHERCIGGGGLLQNGGTGAVVEVVKFNTCWKMQETYNNLTIYPVFCVSRLIYFILLCMFKSYKSLLLLFKYQY